MYADAMQRMCTAAEVKFYGTSLMGGGGQWRVEGG